MIARFKEHIYRGFMDHFDQDESLFKTGKNRLSYEMAIEITKNILEKELQFIQNLTEPLFIEQIEAEMHANIEVETENGTRILHFKGFIDRIDRIGDRYRVIDYKTGTVNKEHVNFKINQHGLIPSFVKGKHAFQLSLYCLFFKEKYGFMPEEAKISSLINVNEAFNLSVSDGDISDMIPYVKNVLEEIVQQLFDPQQAFEHLEDAKYCQYCS
jgi:predicted RecB family nuclease